MISNKKQFKCIQNAIQKLWKEKIFVVLVTDAFQSRIDKTKDCN